MQRSVYNTELTLSAARVTFPCQNCKTKTRGKEKQIYPLLEENRETKTKVETG